METRKEIILSVLKEQYPSRTKGEILSLADDIDKHWHILKKSALDGDSGDWTLAGHVQSKIWDIFAEGAQSSASAHKIIRRMSEEGIK